MLRNIEVDGDGSDTEGDGDYGSDGCDTDESQGNAHLAAGTSKPSTKSNANIDSKKSIAYASSSFKPKQHLGDEEEGKKQEEGQEISITNAASHSLAGDSTSISSPPNFSKVDTALPLESIKLMFPLYYEALTNSCVRSGGSSGSNSSSKDNSNDSSSGSDSSTSSSNSNGHGSRAVLSTAGTNLQHTGDRLESSDNIIPNCVESDRGVRCMEVTIRAGEMLYIPTGWFHEVRSTGGGKDGHLALNYWFHPPDGSTFEKPYTSDFWVNDWKRRNLT